MKRSTLALASGLIIAAPAAAGRAPAAPRMLVVGPDLIVNGTLNGAPVRLMMSLFGERTLFLHPDAARRLEFKPGMFKANGIIGRAKFKGSTAVTTYAVDGVPIKRRIVWFAGLYQPGADGMIGPAAVTQEVIRLDLRPARSGETVHTLPLVSIQGTYGRMGSTVRIGAAEVRLVWDLSRRPTLVTAAAAADLAAANGGRFVAEKRQERVVFNLQRPVRQMAIDRPYVIGPVRLSQVTAWVGEFGDTSQVPDNQADPNEIVVVAKNSKIKPIHAILLGQDDLAHCSSVTFDKPRGQIRMSCL